MDPRSFERGERSLGRRKRLTRAPLDEPLAIAALNTDGDIGQYALPNGLPELRARVEPGDEAVVTDPGYASRIQQIRMYGGVPVF
jgi:hypothetical protein